MFKNWSQRLFVGYAPMKCSTGAAYLITRAAKRE
jgi:hypothetical protein